MQCPSCEFQNMPGSGRCARCGGSLLLSTATINVHPPRAGRIARRMPRFWRLKQAWGNFSLIIGRPINYFSAAFDDANFDLSTVWRLIVPGWATWYRGRPARGLIIFVAFLSLLLPGLALLGTGLGSVLLGLAFSVHIASGVDATIGKFADFSSRLTFTFVCGLSLFLLVYLPIGLSVGRVARPIQIMQSIGEFEQGDVLWYDPSAEVASGDLIFFFVPETRLTGRNAIGQAANYVLPDQWITRILAVGGQTLTQAGGQLLVDGRPLNWRNRTKLGISDGESFVVPEGQVLVPPDALVVGEANFDAATWQRLALVSRANVIGRVYFRSLPFRRISILD